MPEAADAENRVTVSNGQLVNAGTAQAQIILGSEDISFGMSYDAAGHQVARRIVVDGAEQVEVSQYDGRGQLTKVFYPVALNAPAAAATSHIKETRAYDAAGHLSVVATYFGPDEMRQASSGPDISVAGWMKHRERYFYNGDGQLTQQVSEGRLKNWQAWIGVPVGFDFTTVATGYSFMLDKISETFTTYNALGMVGAYDYHYIQHEAGSGASDTDPQNYWQYFSVNYEGRDSYLEKSTAGTSSNPNFQATTSYSKYDAWGKLMAVREKTPLPTDMGTMDDRIRYFTYDGEGGILRRRQGTQANGVFSQTSGEANKDEIYAYTNGQQVARQTREGKVDIAGRHTAYDSMDQGAGTVLVQRGDTLQSLAQRVYGNSQLWYVLADANAMGNTDPIAGTNLKVPDVGAVNKNDAATFKPYNPGEAIGSTAPGLPYMQTPDCPFWKVLVMAVIIVVVTYFTAGAATEAIAGVPAAEAGIGAQMAGAFVGGVVGSAAGQEAGKALGIVDHFSLREAVANGLANAFSAGIAKIGPIADLIKNCHWGLVAMQAALNGVTGYVANKIAGVPDTHFSWTQIAASSVASFVTSAAFGNTPQQDQATGTSTAGTLGQVMGREVARDLTHQMVSSLVQIAMSGKSVNDNDGMWLASALGSGIGYGIVGAIPGTDLYKSLHPTGPTHEQFMASTAYLKDGQNADNGNAFVLPGASAPVRGLALESFAPAVSSAADSYGPAISYNSDLANNPAYRAVAGVDGGYVDIKLANQFHEGVSEWSDYFSKTYKEIPSRGSFDETNAGVDPYLVDVQYNRSVIKPVTAWQIASNNDPRHDEYAVAIAMENERRLDAAMSGRIGNDFANEWLNEAFGVISEGSEFASNAVAESRAVVRNWATDASNPFDAAERVKWSAMYSVASTAIQGLIDAPRMITTVEGRQGLANLVTIDPRTTLANAWTAVSRMPIEDRARLAGAAMLTLPLSELNTAKAASAVDLLDFNGVKALDRGWKLDGVVANSTPARLSFQPSSGVVLEATPGKTTTILGNYGQDMKYVVNELGNIKSTDFGPRVGGFNVLNVPDNLYVTPRQFWTDYNQPWLGNAIGRSDSILMATEPQFGSNSLLFRLNRASGKLELSGFGKEYLYLRQNGFRYDPVIKQMVRSP